MSEMGEWYRFTNGYTTNYVQYNIPLLVNNASNLDILAIVIEYGTVTFKILLTPTYAGMIFFVLLTYIDWCGESGTHITRRECGFS